MTDEVRKGRHRIVSDDEILRAAFHAFAAEGYESMSVRALNTTLGLSHETVRQRFGSKHDLFCASVAHGYAHFMQVLAEERALLPDAVDDLEELRFSVRSLLTTSIRFPEFSNLVTHESASASERIAYIFETCFRPSLAFFAEILERLVAQDVIYPVSIRDAYFLIDAGGSPFAQVGLSQCFDEMAGPLDRDHQVDRFLDFVFRGLVKVPPPPLA